MEFQQGQSYVGAPFPDVEWGDRTALLTLAASAYIAIGEVLCRDDTQLSGDQTWAGLTNTPSGYTPQPDMVVPAKNANAGLVYGILKHFPTNNPAYTPANTGSSQPQVFVDAGATGAPQAAGIYNNNSTAQTFLVVVRWMGYTPGVWAKVASATTINVGSNLVANPGSGGTSDVAQGAATLNKNIGHALASISGGTLVSAFNSAILSTALSTNVYGQINVDLRLV